MSNTFLPFSWTDPTPAARYGNGVSRPEPGNRTYEYRLIVTMPGSRPMKWITRAESKRHAKRYAEARWPGASVEIAA